MHETRPYRFPLSRLFAAVLLFAFSFALIRFTAVEVEQYGGGFFPTLCIFASTLFFIAGLGCVFPRLAALAARAFLAILEVFT